MSTRIFDGETVATIVHGMRGKRSALRGRDRADGKGEGEGEGEGRYW
jgi:hypothetical protein